MNKRYYKVGGHIFLLESEKETPIPASYEPFLCKPDSEKELLFNLTVGNLKPEDSGELIGDFDDENARITVNKLSGGGYLFRTSPPGAGECCIMQTDAQFTQAHVSLTGTPSEQIFGLNNSLMMMVLVFG